MLTRHSWLAGLLCVAALLPHGPAGATEYVLDPSRTIVTFEMRSLGTLCNVAHSVARQLIPKSHIARTASCSLAASLRG